MMKGILGIPGLTPGAAGVWAIFGMLAAALLRHRWRMRQLDIDADKLQIEANSGLRREFIDEMHALRSEVKALREENGLLRREISELHRIIDGMRRENLSAQISGQRVIQRTLMDQLDALPGSGADAPPLASGD
ncbi:hypothetical protein S2M10_29260 [Sphingomonas sp. S2M10]|uniref:hypothetical protein n=1 Tax=Sphingomonas sp. S2M10 TaxID=2705010 RepID=UPI001456C57D|nr:hypothetical protein [Sphingomonas sp. S2M10]NLS27924.1 hypothetical protein [Sphingomonas sp. S2M10]